MSLLASFRKDVVFACISVVVFCGCGERHRTDQELLAASRKTDTPADERIRYSLRTFYEDYLRVGHRSSKWDDAVTNGLGAFARGRITQNTNELWNAFHSLTAAVSSGCDDPLVLYSITHLRYSEAARANKQEADEWVAAAEGLENSRYAPLRKAWGALRAAQAVKAIHTNTPPEVMSWREKIIPHFTSAMEEKDLPSEEACTLFSTYMDVLKRNPAQKSFSFEQMWPLVQKKFPRSAEAWTTRGLYYIDWAWEARGNGYADSVTPEGWKLMKERLEVAEEALEKAWKLKPLEETAIAAIRMELGQGRGRERMEEFFSRAMTLNTNSYRACAQKLFYLYPRWYGSEEEMTEFGWECVHSKKWGGNVPLIMLDVQDELARIAYPEQKDRTNYWKREGIWLAVQSAFEKFFELNPENVSWRHNQFWYAYQCERYDFAKELLPKLGPINYQYFGGKAEFDKMVEQVQAKAR